jgi:hypothetical protein
MHRVFITHSCSLQKSSRLEPSIKKCGDATVSQLLQRRKGPSVKSNHVKSATGTILQFYLSQPNSPKPCRESISSSLSRKSRSSSVNVSTRVYLDLTRTKNEIVCSRRTCLLTSDPLPRIEKIVSHARNVCWKLRHQSTTPLFAQEN